MLVVSDTSSLNYLLLVGCQEVLPALFSRVCTPPAVIEELVHARTPDPARTWATRPPAWLEILALSHVESAPRLGRGEAHALSLALELKADAVLIDERVGQ
jgi:predicted nucleic acid-binding protein